MARNLGMQDISWFLDLYGKEQLDLEPSYQRRSVWSPRDKRFFIDTILNDYPAPPIFLHKSLDDSGRPTYHVVDGKQRLQTIIGFTQDKIRIPDDFGDVSLQKKRWKNLERPTRERFWNYVLIVEMLPDVDDSKIRSTFERINRNSRKLTAQELRHAKYEGWFISTVEAEAEKQEWKDFGVVTTARIKRMADVQFISELFAIILKEQLLGFDQDDLDELYAEYEELAELGTFVEDSFLEEVERIKNIIKDLFIRLPDLKDQLKIQNHFYTLWCYLALQKDRIPPADEFSQKYWQFLSAVSAAATTPAPPELEGSEQIAYHQAVQDYATNTRGANTDLTPRTIRHNALITAIHGPEAVAHEND